MKAHDLYENVTPVFCAGGRLLAAGTGDNTAKTGATVDTRGYGSCMLVLGYHTVLTEAATLALAVELQESADDSTWDTAEVIQATTVCDTGTAGGSTEQGFVRFKIDLTAAESRKRYIRFNYTPNLSAGATDVAEVIAIALLGGAQDKPAA